MRTAAVMLAALASVALGAAPASRPTASTKPTSIPTSHPVAKKFGASDAAARAAVKNAVAALNKEFEQSLRKPADHSLRASCNYLADHPSKEVTADAILPALAGSGLGDGRATAYVRWQLLSGLPAKLDDAAAKQLLAAYRGAPPPMPRVGISLEDQQRMDRIVQSAKQADEPDLRAKMDEALSASRRDNAVILTYREELYHRLPKTPETFAAALEDLNERCNAVADAKDLIKPFVADVRAWAAASDPVPSPQTMVALAKAVRRLADTKGPQYYDSPYWRESAHVFAWHKTRSGVDSGHALKDLAVMLEDQGRQPVVDLTIKTEPQPRKTAATTTKP
jgi:hypothetical protein